MSRPFGIKRFVDFSLFNEQETAVFQTVGGISTPLSTARSRLIARPDGIFFGLGQGGALEPTRLLFQQGMVSSAVGFLLPSIYGRAWVDTSFFWTVFTSNGLDLSIMRTSKAGLRQNAYGIAPPPSENFVAKILNEHFSTINLHTPETSSLRNPQEYELKSVPDPLFKRTLYVLKQKKPGDWPIRLILIADEVTKEVKALVPTGNNLAITLWNGFLKKEWATATLRGDSRGFLLESDLRSDKIKTEVSTSFEEIAPPDAVQKMVFEGNNSILNRAARSLEGMRDYKSTIYQALVVGLVGSGAFMGAAGGGYGGYQATGDPLVSLIVGLVGLFGGALAGGFSFDNLNKLREKYRRVFSVSPETMKAMRVRAENHLRKTGIYSNLDLETLLGPQKTELLRPVLDLLTTRLEGLPVYKQLKLLNLILENIVPAARYLEIAEIETWLKQITDNNGKVNYALILETTLKGFYQDIVLERRAKAVESFIATHQIVDKNNALVPVGRKARELDQWQLFIQLYNGIHPVGTTGPTMLNLKREFALTTGSDSTDTILLRYADSSQENIAKIIDQMGDDQADYNTYYGAEKQKQALEFIRRIEPGFQGTEIDAVRYMLTKLRNLEVAAGGNHKFSNSFSSLRLGQQAHLLLTVFPTVTGVLIHGNAAQKKRLVGELANSVTGSFWKLYKRPSFENTEIRLLKTVNTFEDGSLVFNRHRLHAEQVLKSVIDGENVQQTPLAQSSYPIDASPGVAQELGLCDPYADEVSAKNPKNIEEN